MSEYWVSRKKYYCRYCEIYIADDVPSRTQHENGLRHKGNKERFIRGIYKAGVKQKQENEEEKFHMKRVEEAAQAAYARDIGAGLEKPIASASTSNVSVLTPAPKPRPAKPSDPYANYTTAASLGIKDPDVELLVTQAKARQSEGRAGEWVIAAPPPPPLPQDEGNNPSDGVRTEPGASTGEVRKREDHSEGDEDVRRFKMRKKTASLGLGEIYDPGVIQIKPRAERKPEVDPAIFTEPTLALGNNVTHDDAKPKPTLKPMWTRREWKRVGEESASEQLSQLAHTDAPKDLVKKEEPAEPLISSAASNEASEQLSQLAHTDAPKDLVKKEEPAEPLISSAESNEASLFRKRRAPQGTRGRRQP